ncbi:hypothetical protein BDQ12DRAFT_735153 [Crucibulum laeve]|uniref:FAD/NAD(P)-binding domain-containing protein n=1 Tax=Crucibulum laeve TaxID=68775 RepID=A0A5C3M163_9AGAR|nr:hypothetical protein BDQ12DRAFT_735153 [Crucibulum laeve]
MEPDIVLSAPIAVIGTGPAGLITAHVLLQDGFSNVHLLTRDKTVGGVWARERVYPSLYINNVHGEYRFSALQMPVPARAEETGGRLSGYDMCSYMETFARTHVEDKIKIRFQTEILNLQRRGDGIWVVAIKNLISETNEELLYSRVVVCTGGSSKPYIPDSLSSSNAEKCQFHGPVIHFNESWSRMTDILAATEPIQQEGENRSNTHPIVVIGGGKSAQEWVLSPSRRARAEPIVSFSACTYLVNEGRRVANVFETVNAFVASPKPLPNFIRKSRMTGICSPSIVLRSRLERFLHTTWIGSKIVKYIWDRLTANSFATYKVPLNSPLRLSRSLFWQLRGGDEGVYRPNSYHSFVNSGTIEVVAPARAVGFTEDSVLLSTGERLPAKAVIVCTGYSSSWDGLFDSKIDACLVSDSPVDLKTTETTIAEIGLTNEPLELEAKVNDAWDYTTLANAPTVDPKSERWSNPMYRGIVPAKNIMKRDLAMNGAVFTPNCGYTFELCAHWISAYFRVDAMRLPSTMEQALVQAERNSMWMKRRFPGAGSYINQSYGSSLPYFSWPQAMDELLEDMYMPSMRSGGNWFTWPFKVISVDELASLTEERRAKRNGASAM